MNDGTSTLPIQSLLILKKCLELEGEDAVRTLGWSYSTLDAASRGKPLRAATIRDLIRALDRWDAEPQGAARG